MSIPPDNPQRHLAVAESDASKQPHIGLVGDTYTILLTGRDTAGRFCLIDMYVPPGGGPPPHRHDFEESFTVLEGEIEATFRGVSSIVRAGQGLKYSRLSSRGCGMLVLPLEARLMAKRVDLDAMIPRED